MNSKLAAEVTMAAAALSVPPSLAAQVEEPNGALGQPVSGAAQQQEQEQEQEQNAAGNDAFSIEVEGGLEYDSNVALLDVDTSTNIGDTVASVKLGLGYELPTEGRFGWSAGYDFSQTMHQDLDAFDLRLHRGSSTFSWDFGRTDFGLMLNYADAVLDGESFMTLTQLSPYVTKLAGSKLFLRFSYTGTDKDFAGNAQRAATANALTSDIYVFLNGLDTYLLLEARIDDEDAIDDQFDYESERLRIQLSHRFRIGSRDLTYRAGLRSESRDYSAVTPSINAIRNDDRLQFETSADLPLGERLNANFEYTRADNTSNLPSVDFNENVISFALSATF